MVMIKEELSDIENRIIEAANKVILRHGFDSVTMGEIADEAGISRTSLNYYFRSKQHLFQKVMNNLENKIIPTLSKLIDDDDLSLIEKIDLFVDEYIELVGQYPMVPTFILAEMRHDPEWIIDFFRQKNLNFDKMFAQINTEVEQGSVIPFKPEELFVNMMGLCVFPLLSQPILMEFFFKDKSEKFTEFMGERNRTIKRILHNWLRPD